MLMPKTRTCEHCGKNVNVRYTRCPICGGHLKEKLKPIKPECPRCRKPLKILVENEEEYDICTTCGGMWLDRSEFHLTTRESNVYRKENFKTEYVKGPLKDPGGYVPCVRCGKLMIKKNFGRISGVMIDRCNRHGVWLDAGELEKIRHFIADGGMDKSRDREITKNRDAIKELATTVRDTAFTQRLIHFWNPKRWLFRGWR
jgi:Zn-finger nucleic acid-binding protein